MKRPHGRAVVLGVICVLAALLLWPERPPGPTGAWMAAAGVEPRFETVEGVRLRYVRRGTGPTVILLHGLLASSYTWHDALPAFAADHDVVALDLPGFGGSDQPASLSWQLYGRILPAFMDRLGLERAVLVGHSMGGAVSAELAASHPGRVRGLVLLDPAGFNLAPRDQPWLVRLAGSAPASLYERLPVRRPLVRMGLRQVFHDDSRVTPERVEEYLAPLARPGAMASVRSLLASLDEADAAAFPTLIGRVRAPTLVLWGREDAWIPVDQAELFREAIPGARVVILDGCGHVPQEERASEVVELVRSFLGEL